MRISISLKKADEMEALLAQKFSSFVMKRADKFKIVRKKPVDVRNDAKVNFGFLICF